MKTLIFCSILVLSASVHGTFFTSSQLYQWLENDLNGIETYEGGMAKGYLMGALDMLSGNIPKVVCYPSGISALKVKWVVYNYLRNNQNAINLPVDKMVFQAFTQEWPCK